jgi:hypothetical protein
LTDYAKGRPNAQVILVNYGPAPSSIVKKVDSRYRSRVKLIGDMKPGSDGSLAEFKELVAAALRKVPEQRTVTKSPDRSVALPMEVVLTWNDEVSDLDLYLTIESEGGNIGINHREKGMKESHPFAVLREDVRDGNGPEIIDISSVVGKTYRVHVHNYSKEQPLTRSGAKITIGSFVINCPTSGEGSWWDVVTIEMPGIVINPTNFITDDVSRLPIGLGELPDLPLSYGQFIVRWSESAYGKSNPERFKVLLEFLRKKNFEFTVGSKIDKLISREEQQMRERLTEAQLQREYKVISDSILEGIIQFGEKRYAEGLTKNLP